MEFRSATTEIPLPPLLQSRRFAKREITMRDTYLILWFVVALAALLVARKLLTVFETKRGEQAMWDHIRQICSEHSLPHGETETLLRILKGMRLRHPVTAVTSLHEFDDRVFEKLRAAAGESSAGTVRKQLFLSPVSSKPSAGRKHGFATHEPPLEAPVHKENKHLPPDDELFDLFDEKSAPAEPRAKEPPPARRPGKRPTVTRALIPGQSLQLKVPGAGLLVCGVMRVDDRGVVLSLPDEGPPPKALESGAIIEGFVPAGEHFYCFDTEIIEVFPDDVPTCRIAHAENQHEVKRRKFARARIHYPFRFYHIRAADVGTPEAKRNRELRSGVLEDISAGGCAVAVDDALEPVEEGDFLRFPILIPGEESPLKVTGRVIRTEGVEGKGPTAQCLHVQFMGMNEQHRHRMVSAVYKLQKSNPDADHSSE